MASHLTILDSNENIIYSDNMGNITIKIKDESLTFYYMNNIEQNDISGSISITAKVQDYVELSTFAIVLIAIISFIFLYTAFSCIKYCIEARKANNSREALLNWVKSAPTRTEKIMSETENLHYDCKNIKFSQTNCVVCLADFIQNEPIIMLKCKHIFHKRCIESWVKSKIYFIPKCPMCVCDLTDEKPPIENFDERILSEILREAQNFQNPAPIENHESRIENQDNSSVFPVPLENQISVVSNSMLTENPINSANISQIHSEIPEENKNQTK